MSEAKELKAGPITLSPRARQNIEELIEAEEACGDPQEAADLTMLLKAHDMAAELLAALRPLARLEIPFKSHGNAGAYSIRHDHIRAAREVIAKIEGK